MFVVIVQKCSSIEVPTSSIQYPESTAFCDSNIINGTVSHAVQLGVHCGTAKFLWDMPLRVDTVTSDYNEVFQDLFSECGDRIGG